MRDHTKRFIALTLVCALPVLGGADDEWKNLYSLAVGAANTKDFAKADAIFSRALRDAELFGKADVRVATTLEGLANLQRAEKHLAEAEESANRAVAIFLTNPGDQSLEFGQGQYTLAAILMDEGKYLPALDAIGKAVPLIDSGLGPDATATADAICLQGDAFRLVKRYASAQPQLKHCADLRADINGVNTAAFGDAANSLALVYQHLSQLKEADRYFSYAAKIREITAGIMSPELADTLEAHAQLLHQMGRDGEAKVKEHMAAVIRAHAAKK